MSIGYHGFAKLFSEDDNFVYYAYSGANFNDKTRDEEANYYYDGRFQINTRLDLKGTILLAQIGWSILKIFLFRIWLIAKRTSP